MPEDRKFEDKKYVVYKVGDVKYLYPIDDAVVIRHQDVFAASAFYAYANSIRTAVEIMEMRVGETKLLGVDARAEVVGRLNGIADYFIDQAMKAEASERTKIPD